jgi:hypothetical protein
MGGNSTIAVVVARQPGTGNVGACRRWKAGLPLRRITMIAISRLV